MLDSDNLAVSASGGKNEKLDIIKRVFEFMQTITSEDQD